MITDGARGQVWGVVGHPFYRLNVHQEGAPGAAKVSVAEKVPMQVDSGTRTNYWQVRIQVYQCIMQYIRSNVLVHVVFVWCFKGYKT